MIVVKNTLEEIFLASEKLNDFSIISPISTKKEINKAFDYIKSLNPKPSGGLEDSNITEFLIPDFIVKKKQ